MKTTEIESTFTLNDGRIFTLAKSGYCFVKENGKTSRTSHNDLMDAYRLFKIEEAARAEMLKDIEENRDSEQAAEDALDAIVENPEVILNEHGLIVCHDCDNKTCIHRDCMRRNPEEVGGLGLCPRWIAQDKTTLDVSKDLWDEMLDAAEEEEAQEAKKTKKRTRKSKDIAYTYSENGQPVVTLTAKQVDFVKHLPDTCFWENGLDSCIWVDCLCDEIGGQFAGKPMTVGAMISTLCEKGLGQRAKSHINGKKATSFALTELGRTVFATGWGLN